ncbi:hypothetical protein C8R46DRAFT_1218926 [Mycena filopes]|nr:hypothetical protein C8R46DRAFT_1218926 [Mycena filopes]
MQFTIVSVIALALGVLVAQAAPVQLLEDLAVRTPAEVTPEVEDRGCKLYACF